MGVITNLSQTDPGYVTDTTPTDSVSAERHTSRRNPLVGAYVALVLFMVIYCGRPEDWIPGLSYVPLAKIAGIVAILASVFSLQHIRTRFPREVTYLFLLFGQLFLASLLSPVWRGGALLITVDFAKILVIVVVMTAAVNTTRRLRLLIFVQAASVAMIAAVSVLKGRSLGGRLSGVLGGDYSNSNDLALAIVISLPLCLGLLFLSRNKLWKAAWALAILVMFYAVFLTGSRGGFLALVVTAALSLWEFAIRGRRRYLLVLAALVGVILWQSSSGMLGGRLKGTFDEKNDAASAYGSAQARQQVFWNSVEVTKEHPLFGIGPGNFQILSGNWLVTHNSFTQLTSEGGVPAFILYVLILWCGIQNVRATKRLARRQKESRLLAGALRASLAGFIVGSVFSSVAYQFFPYLLVAYTTALFGIAKKSASHSKLPESVSQVSAMKDIHRNTTESEMSWDSC
jgi:putative inorganic carbon (hco3(-)) transporter